MFADHWVLAQLVAQSGALFLLAVAAFFATEALPKWSPQSAHESQIVLERKSYLISSIVQYVLIFQLATLFVFLTTVNNHLPGLIKGAMCASGTLGLNAFGYPLLYLKLSGIVIYSAFIFLNYLDFAEPEYPLTRIKLSLIFPILIINLLDLVLTFQYFNAIEPDVIATCCSISFSGTSALNDPALLEGAWISPALLLYYLAGGLLLFLLLFKRRFAWLELVLASAWGLAAVYALKFHFVKFIYALPSHNCLFDIFWARYYYIGYLLFGTILALFVVILLINLWVGVGHRLKKNHNRLVARLYRAGIVCLTANMAVLSGYWMFWKIFR